MTAKDLNNLLTGRLSPKSFVESIKSEVQNYQHLMSKRGSTIDLILVENEIIEIDTSKLSKLLNLVVDNQLTNVHLAYICDCLSLSDEVCMTDNKIKDIVFRLADPAINGGFVSKQEILELLDNLK